MGCRGRYGCNLGRGTSRRVGGHSAGEALELHWLLERALFTIEEYRYFMGAVSFHYNGSGWNYSIY
jgi:hypothetical protein